MLSRRDLALGLGGVFVAGPALARAAEPLPPPGETVTGQRTRRDRDMRMTIPVMIGAAGPFQFVVDTGADCSVIASEVAAGLALPSGADVLIHGITGVELTGTVVAPPLRLGTLTLSTRDLPVLPRERLGGDGLLGMDVLKNNRLVLDFRQKRMEIRTGSGRPPSRLDSRFISVPAGESFGRLTVINAWANNVSVTAFVDSGATMSIVNPALATAMRADRRWNATAPQVELAGVTEQVVTGEGRTLDRLRIGSLSFSHIPVVIADLHLFNRWNLRNKPAILLGVDVLRLFARVELDYGRRRLLFRAGLPTAYQV